MVELQSGTRLWVAEYGHPQGFPVLAFHGAPATRLMFELASAPAIRLGLRPIAPDRPGCGLSPPETEPRTLLRHAADMVALADELGLDRPGLIGISGGGPYAAATAALLGRRAAGLALVSPVGPLADGADVIAMAHLQRRFFLDLPRHPRIMDTGAGLAALLFHAAPSPTAWLFGRLIGGADRETLSRRAARDTVLAMTRDALRQGVSGPLADLVVYGSPWGFDPRTITAPAIVWQGTDDIVVPPAGAYRLAGLIPGCQLRRLPGAGHFWVLDHVEDVLQGLSMLMLSRH
jgi:pimeloyl-ACP methyl ester carboxylesterase